jgi:hypothetical protein
VTNYEEFFPSIGNGL